MLHWHLSATYIQYMYTVQYKLTHLHTIHFNYPKEALLQQQCVPMGVRWCLHVHYDLKVRLYSCCTWFIFSLIIFYSKNMITWAITHRDAVEVGLVHHVQHHLAHFAVVHSEVVVDVLPLFEPQQLHHSGQSLGDHPNAIIGEAVELAGFHTFLLKLPAILPLILLRGLEEREGKRWLWQQ